MPAHLRPIRRLLVANRWRNRHPRVPRRTELGIRTVAIYAEEDKLSLHRFKADEAYQVGAGGKGPIAAYLVDRRGHPRRQEARVDAIHPGYGFLSENPEFAEACARAGIVFIGPTPETMRTLGNKVAARKLAIAAGVPVMPGHGPPCRTIPRRSSAGRRARLSGDAQGRLGRRRPRHARRSRPRTDCSTRSARAGARRRPRSATPRSIWKSWCAAPGTSRCSCWATRTATSCICSSATAPSSAATRRWSSSPRRRTSTRPPRQHLRGGAARSAAPTDYDNAGTVEFLVDTDTGEFYFIEVNPRIQVEHTVTEMVTGLDIVKAQIRIAEGGRIGDPRRSAFRRRPISASAATRSSAASPPRTRRTTSFPDYGRITAYRGAVGFGIRVDGGTAYSGAVVTPFYDSLLEKVTAWAPTPEEAIARMDRALREYPHPRRRDQHRRSSQTVLAHPNFLDGSYTTRFIDKTPELFQFAERRDRATKLLALHRRRHRQRPSGSRRPRQAAGHCAARRRRRSPAARAAAGHASSCSNELGPERLRRVDAGAEARAGHRHDHARRPPVAAGHAHAHLRHARDRRRLRTAAAAAVFAGMWGGATFDIAMRFLTEDPWQRLANLRERVPNILFQMLLRGANARRLHQLSRTTWCSFFVKQAAAGGIDVFRIFDCLNWVENMRVAIDAVRRDRQAVRRRDLLHRRHPRSRPRQVSTSTITSIWPRSWRRPAATSSPSRTWPALLKPARRAQLVKALKEEIGMPIHLHTHDTSRRRRRLSVLAAIEAGVDAVDAAMDAMAGCTSQPCLGSHRRGAAAHRARHRTRRRRHPPISDSTGKRCATSTLPFESDLKRRRVRSLSARDAGRPVHQPERAGRALGLEHPLARGRRAYARRQRSVRRHRQGDAVVEGRRRHGADHGDARPERRPTCSTRPRTSRFPASVVEMLRGDLGQPPGGWPEALIRQSAEGRGADHRAARLASRRQISTPSARSRQRRRRAGRFDLASYLMYPKVFTDFARAVRKYGPVSVLPTPVYFYGMKIGDEITVEIERGKSLVISLQAVGETDEDGQVEAFFELNGQPRIVSVPNRAIASQLPARRKAEDGNDAHVAAPMPGMVSALAVKPGAAVKAGDILMTIEAMKMETALHSPRTGTIKEVLVHPGSPVEAKDFLVVFEG